MALKNRGYEKLLDEYAAYTPYKTFEAEAGMRRGADIQAVKAGLTQKLRRAEPEGAVSSYYLPGQRGSTLMNYGALASPFADRRAALAGAQGKIAGNVEAREQMYKSKYIYENLLDNLAAEEATIGAEKEYHQGIMKAVTAAATTSIASAAGLAKLVKKYDAMQMTPEAAEKAVADTDEELELAKLEDARTARFMSGLEETTAEDEALFQEPKITSQAGAEIEKYKGLQPQLEQGTELVVQAKAELDEAQAEWDMWRDKIKPLAYGEDPDDLSNQGRRVAMEAIDRLNKAKERYDRLLRAYAVMGGYEESLAGGLKLGDGRLAP